MKRFSPLFLAALLVAAPTLLHAQASKHFPIPEACPGAAANVPEAVGVETMNVRLVVKGAGPGQLPHVSTDQIVAPGSPNINLFGCMDGKAVVKSSVDQICVRAIQQGFTCSGFSPAFADSTCDCIPGGGDPDDCGVAPATAPLSLSCTIGGPTSGFFLNKPGAGAAPAALGFEISPVAAASQIVSLNHSTQAGNEIGTDMLPQYLVRVVPNGVLGDVDFAVFHSQGGQNPRRFTVTVTASLVTDLLALANAIASGFNGLGLGLLAEVPNFPVRQYSPTFSPGPGSAGAPFVRVANAGTVTTQINVKGRIGQDVEAETSDPALASVPTLNQVGLVVLVGILILSGLWLERRRRSQE